VTLSASPASAQAADSRYARYYFKERQSLKLDTARIAVFRAPDEQGAAVPAPDVARYGLDPSAIAMAVRGWSYVKTTTSVRTDTAIERAVSQIAHTEPVGFVSPVFVDDQGEPMVITPYILVGFDRSLDPARAEDIIATSGAGVIVDRDWGNMKRTYRLKSASRDGFKTLEAANALARRPEARYAEPDMMVTVHPESIPNDTYFPYLWGLHNDGTNQFPCGTTVTDFDMDAPEAWDVTAGDPSIIVTVLDTGVQQNHPDLNLYTPGIDCTGEDGFGDPVNACDIHGTPVAGCVSGIRNNNLGIVGVAPGVKVASARIGVSSVPCDNFAFSTTSSWVVCALTWAESIGSRITNSSWGRSTPLSAAYADKYAETRANGMVHFASAGNEASNAISYPAAYPGVNAVAALDPCGHRAAFSNYGTGLAFSAPGDYVISTDRTGTDGLNDGILDGACLPNGTARCSSNADCPAGQTCFLVSVDYALVRGTSFASPYTAGVAALVLSVQPNLTADQLEGVLKLSAVDLGAPGYDTGYGWGFVNAFNAVQSALSGPPNGPGEATDLRVTSFNAVTGRLGLSYVPACGADSHDIYYGPLSQIATYGYSGSSCGIGNTGQYADFNPGPGSYFFVLVGNAGAVNGSYGTKSTGAQRPAADASYCGQTRIASSCP
jgi:subtilisin family serine protease